MSWPNEVLIIISGRVQGVGFRATTLHYAQQLGIHGTVRNLEDGSVEILMQAEPEKISLLIKALSDHFEIAKITKTERMAVCQYNGFIVAQ